MIGQAIDRADGPLKVTGRARYTLDRREAGVPLSGVVVGSAIGRGRITGIDTARAERAPGVALVVTHRNVPAQGAVDTTVASQFARARPVFVGDRIGYAGQPVALVVADTLAQAQAAAALLQIDYASEGGSFAVDAQPGYAPARANAGFANDTAVGDLDRAMADAPVTLDHSYSTSWQAAHAMEPHACVAAWKDGTLHVWASLQRISTTRLSIAATLGIPVDAIHIDAAFVGGGFGSKLSTHAEIVCAAIATRALGRPVRVALTRRQMASMVGGRPETVQRVRLAATRDGRLMGIGHAVRMQGSPGEEFTEQTATVTRSLYAAPHRATSHRVVVLDRMLPEPVRGPGELPGLLAVEAAVDELAFQLGIDPVALRLYNDTAVDPERGVPLSGRKLADCLVAGAERFGWSQRPARPASQRDGRWQVGWGVASAIRIHFQGATRVVVRVGADGRVQVLSDMTDIGTGTYTILAQVAAESLGLPLAQIDVQLARSDLPVSGGSGGSWGAANTSVALARACEALKAKARAASRQPGGADGKVRYPVGLQAEGSIAGQGDDPRYRLFSQHTYGATFAEVGVDADTCEVRVRRMLGVFAAGRILNPKTARSQLIGGMAWGIGSALHEAGHLDPRSGHMLNRDLGEYLVPTHADVPAIEAVLLEDFDDAANTMGIKGVGELGVCGSGAAVANAVFHATGVRLREFPLTADRLLMATHEASGAGASGVAA
ncbi:xanthine dehydrogenase family protein molybdopterin-binding subunit [Pseudorhodoferax soli]|uniref:Xanthine dehydrogenase YagR molybdenum-binding subunit n=1 Tax=Pseudorhodoferax soli TaxID=545864 RepID=A0A368XZ81_9BURK|nr:xanthine dehydrogenase family protein molybdopterin-binding subunit [Pseudorhodoferax soli]RCW72456.1 xanthine dehydrogenase YagR molybdenum-binding subunit [Pseudorhodoferax soli]